MSTVDLLPDPVEAAAALKAPSERAQDIYYQATIESRSQREIAKEFQISQPRVQQVIAKVLAWVGDTPPGVAGEMTARLRFQAATQITRDRLLYYPGLLVEKFLHPPRATLHPHPSIPRMGTYRLRGSSRLKIGQSQSAPPAQTLSKKHLAATQSTDSQSVTTSKCLPKKP